MELNLQKIVFPEKNKLEYAKKYVSDLKLYYDKMDYIYYQDVIFKILYKLYGTKIDRENPENNLIFKTEKKILKKIKSNINDYIQRKRELQNKKEKQKNFLITFNPLTSHLYYKFSFAYMKTFMNYYKENSQLIQHLKENIVPGYGNNNKNENLESSELSDSDDKSEEDEDEEEEEEEDDDENEEEEDNNENEEGESKEQNNSSSLNVPDNNNLYNYYKNNNNNNQNKNSENNSEIEIKDISKGDI